MRKYIYIYIYMNVVKDLRRERERGEKIKKIIVKFPVDYFLF